MSGKAGRGGCGPNSTRDARTALTDSVKSMFAWLGPKAARMTCYEVLMEHYSKFATITPVTLRRYACEIRRWERLTGSPKLYEISQEHFWTFRQAALNEGLLPSSIEGSTKVAKIILRFAKDSGWIKSLPNFGKPLRVDSPPADPATLDEIEALYRIADHASRPASGDVSPADWWRTFLVLELWTGLRIGDMLFNLKWENVEADRIMFRANKTSRLHIFPRCPVVDAHLRLVEDWHDTLVIGTIRQSTAQQVRDEMRFLCEEAGLRTITPHQLRDACVTNWLIAGESAGRIIHGAGLTIAERHYAGKLQLLTEASTRFRWPPSMLAMALPVALYDSEAS